MNSFFLILEFTYLINSRCLGVETIRQQLRDTKVDVLIRYLCSEKHPLWSGVRIQLVTA